MTLGLKALHDSKICHRDLKCANVFMTTKGEVKLGDFNVSKVLLKGMLHTQTGTPYYASPEVWQDKPYDTKSDIWSIGCILYEMIAKIPPFKSNSMKELYKKVISAKYIPI
jgi:NIMA (never in mitosis gene a)-related kinase